MKRIGFALALVMPLLVLGSAVMAAYQTASPVEQQTTAGVGVNEYIDFTISVLNATDGLNFGSLNPGTIDGPSLPNPAVTLTVHADSNIDVNVRLKGNDWTGPASLTLASTDVQYDDDATLDQGTETGLAQLTLTTSYPTSAWWTATNAGTDQTEDVYYWITIPSDQTAGDYSTSFYFEANRA